MEFFHPSFTRHGARDLKDIKRGNQLKSSKRQEMEELNEGADDNDEEGFIQSPQRVAKKPLAAFGGFASDPRSRQEVGRALGKLPAQVLKGLPNLFAHSLLP